MYLDYSKLDVNDYGMPEQPTLILKTMSEDTIGVIPCVHNLKMNIKFAEPSEIEFDIPAVMDDGRANLIFEDTVGYKIIYTEHYGVYVIINPNATANGISDIRHIKGYSLEKTLDSKKFYLDEGTFRFYDQTNPSNPDTIIGRILEVAVGWRVGYIDPSVAQRYRTFDQYDDYLMSFMYGNAKEKFRCVFVFDTYEKSINVYDADGVVDTLPIYLDFDNLIEELSIEEMSEELVTAIRPYGSDGLDIRGVNPIGSNWIYDLSYFISNGDIPTPIAEKWNVWQRSVLNHREYYNGLVALQASATAELLSAQTKLTDMNGELETLQAQQSVTIQALAMETTEEGKRSQQEVLNRINADISTKRSEISSQNEVIASIKSKLDVDNPSSYSSKIKDIVNELSITNYFSSEEYAILSKYMIEQDITEDSFVATDIDQAISGSFYQLKNESVSINSIVQNIDLTKDFGKRMYTLSGGTFSFSGNHSITGDIIRGTLEISSDNNYILSIYAGAIRVGAKSASGGMITASGIASGMNTGNASIRFSTTDCTLYLTANISDYQKYSVQLELYDYALNILNEAATPIYEFSVDSGNFVFSKDFAPFRNRLELGKGVYLNVGGKQTITPYIIEFELDFERPNSFSIVFSNRFKRRDSVNSLKDMVEKSYSSSRSFDANRYIYKQAANKASEVSRFISSSLDAAVNTIVGAANQSVIINGAGINVGGESPCQIRIVNNMIALSDDNWATAKLAIGRFASDEVGVYFGINAEVVGGKLIVGNNLVIENETDDGVMQFKVDSSGAWLNNSTFVLQKDAGGKILIDPKYGIVAGNGELFNTDGTAVYPLFIDNDGDVKYDSDGMPDGSNFYLDIRDGSAYFRGKLTATSGKIGGFSIESDFLHTGSGSNYVALNGSGSNTNSAYAIWAGASSPSSAKFYVKKDGTLYAKDGNFGGTLSAAKLSGNLTANATSDPNDGGWLIGCGINVGNGNFYVDNSGNVTMKGSINLSNGNITWGTGNSPVRVLYARNALSTPYYPYSSYPSSSSTDWHQTMSVAYDYYASYSYDGGQTWTAAIRIQGKDGVDGEDGVDGSDATVNEKNVFNVLTNGGTKFGIFSDSTANRLYINANYIQTGYLDADLIELACGYGGFCKGRGYTGERTTYGSMMYGSNGMGEEPYFIVTNTGCRMSAENDIDFYVTGSGVYASEEITIKSDRRLKNSIEYNFDRYEKFFMDLKPAFFQYNNGKSGRLHSGFIAQDVEQALTSNGLTAKDFAGLVIVPVIEVNDADGITDNYYKLRYGEFISLNTYMIQKLYHRIEELENKLKKE